MITKDLTIEQYHEENKHYSASCLKHALRSLKELKFYMDDKLEEKKGSHFDFGNAFETALIEESEFSKKVSVFDPSRKITELLEKKPDLKAPTMTNEFKEFKESFYSDNEDKYIIQKEGKESLDTISEMILSCKDNETVKTLLKGMEKQVSIFWTDEKTGVKLKTRPDVSRTDKNILVDIKTTRDASPRAFSKQINDLNYWMQAVMQIDGCLSSGFMGTVDFYFWIAVEKEAPYNVAIYEFHKDDIDRKFIEYRLLLEEIAICEKENKWPGYEFGANNDMGILTAKIW